MSDDDNDEDIMRVLEGRDTPSDAGSAAMDSGRTDNGDGDGSFDDGVDDDMLEEPAAEEPSGAAQESTFSVGTPVIVRRGGKWSGTVINYGSDETNFLTFGKYLVRYEYKTRKGRGYTSTTTTAWVAADDLAMREVSPRKAAETTTGSSASHSAGTRV